MTRHVDAESLGRFSAGDLSRSRAARIGVHLRGCSRCAELSRQLAGVTALLASVPAPPMPEHLATRISSSLAAEAARRAGRDPTLSQDQAARTARPRRTAQPGRTARTRWLPRLGFPAPVAVRVLAVTGAAAVLAGGSYAILRATSGRPGSGFASPAAGHAARPVIPSHGGLSAAPTAGGGAALGPALSYQASGGLVSFKPVATAGNYLPGHLAAQATSALAEFGELRQASGTTQPANLKSPSAGQSRAAARSSRFDGVLVSVLEGCVRRVAAGHQVLLVDLARYRGSPATVIVVSEPAAAADHLWVVGPACSGSSSDVLAQASLPR